ncbi:glutathione S-transferase N-terminal domain-containing protein [Inmirania thermothiophila]|uniref:RNA polymerase-associated protein n=1 Tax=Inmirania thermothiophila TaxID=1750597 RepID=A0A3N1XSN7_9GAMM|nr:glutathione S-transferase N-terminal domain-containing protein [Inmirania thermothiophila]ROR29666.1 RNA polymerase-associated protein [Inmirania thermothiophila]
MALAATRRTVMTLFSDPLDPYSHQTRIVLAEKGIQGEVEYVAPGAFPEDLLELNPYQSLPTLLDRDLVLYNARVIMEYLDERFPHPPLMPIDPVARARIRLGMFRIEHDWYRLIRLIEGEDATRADKARRLLRDSLTASAELFELKPFFLNEELTLADCCLMPLLWRLPAWGVELPREARPVIAYAERMFARDAFRESLSEAERELRG